MKCITCSKPLLVLDCYKIYKKLQALVLLGLAVLSAFAMVVKTGSGLGPG
jgi:hypothetical protein